MGFDVVVVVCGLFECCCCKGSCRGIYAQVIIFLFGVFGMMYRMFQLLYVIWSLRIRSSKGRKERILNEC